MIDPPQKCCHFRLSIGGRGRGLGCEGELVGGKVGKGRGDGFGAGRGGNVGSGIDVD